MSHTHAAVIESTPGLVDAYILSNNALEAGLDLNYWRNQLMNLVSDASHLDTDMNDSDEESHSDPELQQALRLSREEFYGERPKGRDVKWFSNPPTSSLSPPRSAEFRVSRRVPIIAGAGSVPSTNLSSFETSSRPVISSSQPSRNHGQFRAAPSPQDRLNMRRDTPIDLTDDSSAQNSTEVRTVESRQRQFQQRGFLDHQLGGVGRGRKEPISDTIDGEL